MNKFRFSNQAIFISVFVVIFAKVLLFFLFNNDYLILPVGGGSDADYYDAFAKGYEDYTTSLWPVFLKFIFDNGFYSRSFVSQIVFFIHLFLIPFFANNGSSPKGIFQRYFPVLRSIAFKVPQGGLIPAIPSESKNLLYPVI